MKTFNVWLKVAFFIAFGCFYTNANLFAASTFSASPSTSAEKTLPGGATASQKMLYGPVTLGFIVEVRGPYWGGNSTNWASYVAQCPAGSIPTTNSPPAPYPLVQGQVTAEQFKADAVACGCGQGLRCYPGLMGSINPTGGAGVWTRAYCTTVSLTGYLPESYFQTNATKFGTFYEQDVITSDPANGKTFFYKYDTGDMNAVTGVLVPGLPKLKNPWIFVWTGHTCANPG